VGLHKAIAARLTSPNPKPEIRNKYKIRGKMWMVGSFWLAGLLLSGLGARAADSISNSRVRLEAQIREGQIRLQFAEQAASEIWADGPYLYSVDLSSGLKARGLNHPGIQTAGSRLRIRGELAGCKLEVTQELSFHKSDGVLEERMTLANLLSFDLAPLSPAHAVIRNLRSGYISARGDPPKAAQR
jgi:hypothetical protein